MITKAFWNTNMKIVFRTNNTIKQHLKIKQRTTDKYNLCGVYQMNSGDCELKYIDQTGFTFRTRYKEHIREIKTNEQKSKYAQHILDTTHEYVKIEQTMKILHLEKKGRMLNALESYHN
jgi:Zn-dependent metalloprotease